MALRTLALAAALMLPASAGAPALAETGDTFSTSFADVGSPVSGVTPAAGAVDVSAIAPTGEAPAGAGRALGSGTASYYADKFNGRRTASGEPFSNRALTAAHRSLPFGSKVRVTNPATGRSVVVRINDRGPFHGGRVIDLSRNAAEQVGIVQRGHGAVELALID